ncbi:hypothetical protein GGI20_004699 [Coemansia sp. BCRC 34301]|nr:hypothetical protein GGI20_004699 [Coemansia sp. BCRC 34301]
MAAEKCTLFPEQLFESQDAFINHVKGYAVENGFNVRLDDVERDKGGKIRKRDIVCSSEGAPRGKESSGKREDSAGRSDVEDSEPMTPTKPSCVAHSGAHRRKSMKTGCRWLARASRQSSGMWKVIMLRLEHNHPLTTRYELFQPSAHVIRTGDDASISNATSAARAAMAGGSYRGPSIEFKNLFLQMSAACADLCWSAARHPETVAEVLSEIRRLNQHLEKHAENEDYELHASRSPRAISMLPTVSESGEDVNGEAVDASDKLPDHADSSLVMMGHSISDMVNHRMSSAQQPPQPSHFLNVPPHSASHHMEMSISDSPAQILARSQNRHIVEAQSPELNSTSSVTMAMHNGIVPDSALSPTTATAQPTAGPVKRSRGRPRKNPLDGKPTKPKAQQKRNQQPREQLDAQQLAHPAPTKPTPTPADLASLSHKIINQNIATSPVNVQRPLASSLALPPQPMQMHSHHVGRASMIAGGSVPPILDTRSHASSVQRQPQQPVPQPQQSPTFFLGAAEGIGYSERSAAAAAATAANMGFAATTANPTPNPTEAVGSNAAAAAATTATTTTFYAYQKPARANWDPATAAAAAAAAAAASVPAATGLSQYPAAAAATTHSAAATYASSSANVLRGGGLPSPATVATVPPTAAATPVPRSAAIPAIPTASASNASAPVSSAADHDADRYPAPRSGRSRAAATSTGERDGSNRSAKSWQASTAGVAADSGVVSSDSPHLGNAIAPAFHGYQPYQQHSYHSYQQQQQQQQQHHAEQPPDSVGAGSPPVSAISQLVISSSSAITGAAGGYSTVHLSQPPNPKNGSQRATTAHPGHQYQYHQSHQHFLQQQHQSQQQLLQLGRDPTGSTGQLNPYLLMSRAHQQQQKQLPRADISAHQLPPTAALSSLPPMAHNGGMMPGTSRRLDELQLNQYQSWQ